MSLCHALLLAALLVEPPPAPKESPPPAPQRAPAPRATAPELSEEDKEVVENLELLESLETVEDLDLLLELDKEE
jgi:3-oxoacyl-ACP reductase-like protein